MANSFDPNVLAELGRALIRMAEMISADTTTPEERQGLLSGPDLDRALGISPSTRSRLVRAGVLPYSWVGAQRRYDLAACRSALAARGRTVVPASTGEAKTTAAEIDVIAARAGLRRVGS